MELLGFLYSFFNWFSFDAIINFLKENSGTAKEPLRYIGSAIAIIPAFGSCLGQGIAVGRFAEAISRNPEVAPIIKSNFITGCAIAETSVLLSFLISILILYAG